MKSTIIALDLFAVFVDLVILYGNFFEMRHTSRKKQFFGAAVSVSVGAALSNLLCWVIDGNTSMIPLMFVLTIITLLALYVSSALFVGYMLLHVSEKNSNIPLPWKPIWIITATLMVLSFVACIKGQLFSLDGAHYSQGAWFNLYLASALFYFGYMLYIIFTYASDLGMHDSIAMFSYTIIPILGILSNAVYPNLSLFYPTSSLSFLLVYVMLQSEQEGKYISREEYLSQMSRQDDLTGLLNRRAFIERCTMLAQAEIIGVVFCDVNGLKYTNDHQGHDAGDQLLKGFAAILIANFRKDEIFRVSGDEFVVLLPGITREAFHRRVSALRAKLAEQEIPCASVGIAFGDKVGVEELISMAEKSMYSDKTAFYERFPLYKRN